MRFAFWCAWMACLLALVGLGDFFLIWLWHTLLSFCSLFEFRDAGSGLSLFGRWSCVSCLVVGWVVGCVVGWVDAVLLLCCNRPCHDWRRLHPGSTVRPTPHTRLHGGGGVCVPAPSTHTPPTTHTLPEEHVEEGPKHTGNHEEGAQQVGEAQVLDVHARRQQGGCGHRAAAVVPCAWKVVWVGGWGIHAHSCAHEEGAASS